MVYHVAMIVSFASKKTEELFNGIKPKGLPSDIEDFEIFAKSVKNIERRKNLSDENICGSILDLFSSIDPNRLSDEQYQKYITVGYKFYEIGN